MSIAPNGPTPAAATDDREMVVLLAGRDTNRLREHVAPLLDRPAVTVETVADQSAAVDVLEGGGVDCLVATYDPKGGEGMAVLDYLREEGDDVPVILMPSTRTTVIDSRNFVVDVESVVDPEDSLPPGGLAEDVVSTVEQQRAAVAARRRHQVQSALRGIARDAADAEDEAAVARSVAERLGGTDAADAAWVAALVDDDEVDVRATARDGAAGGSGAGAADAGPVGPGGAAGSGSAAAGGTLAAGGRGGVGAGGDGGTGGAVPGDGDVTQERIGEAVAAAFDADGPAVTTEGSTGLASVPVEAPDGERWGVTVASDSRYAFAEPEMEALAELRDTIGRALSALEAERSRTPGAPDEEVDPGAFAELVEHLDVPVLAYDEDGLVHAASPGFGELLDRDHEALRSDPVWEVLPEPRLETFEEHWAEFEEGDAHVGTLSLGGASRQVVTTRLVLEGQPYNVVLPVDPQADADTWLAEVLAYEMRHWMAVAESEGTDEEMLDTVAERVEAAVDAEVDASGSMSDLHVTAQPLGSVASEAWAQVLGDAGSSAVQGGRTVLADRTVLLRLFTHLFRTLFTYGEASSVSVGVHDAGFFVRDDGSGIPHDERAYAETTAMTDAESGASIRVARRLAKRHGWELVVEANEEGGTRFDVRGVRSPYRDVSDQDLRKTQLGVLNRVLRHNVRNKLNVIRGNADLLADRLSGEAAELFEHLHSATADLVAIGDRAREFEQLEAHDEIGPRRIDLAGVVDRVVDAVTDEYPGATVTTEVDDDIAIETYPDALRIVLTNLLRNAAEHSDRSNPDIEVTARRAGGTVGVAIRDDGPGIPDQELEVLSEGAETPLEHGSGLGLWVTKWGVQYLGGDLAFEENGSRGTTAIVTLPRRAPDADASPRGPAASD